MKRCTSHRISKVSQDLIQIAKEKAPICSELRSNIRVRKEARIKKSFKSFHHLLSYESLTLGRMS